MKPASRQRGREPPRDAGALEGPCGTQHAPFHLHPPPGRRWVPARPRVQGPVGAAGLGRCFPARPPPRYAPRRAEAAVGGGGLRVLGTGRRRRMAAGMAAAVSDSLSSAVAPDGGPPAPLLLLGRRGRCERCPHPHVPASTFVPLLCLPSSLPPCLSPLFSRFSPAAALAGGVADTLECGLRSLNDPAPR